MRERNLVRRSFDRFVPGLPIACIVIGLGIVLRNVPEHASLASLLMVAAVLLSVGVVPLLMWYVATNKVGQHERFVWLVGSMAAGFLFLGEAADQARRLGQLDSVLIGLISLVGFLTAGALGLVAMRHLVEPLRAPRRSTSDDVMDIGTVVLGIALLMMTFVLPARDANQGLGLGRSIVHAFYPSLALGFVVYVVVFKRTKWLTWQVLMMALLVGLGVKHAYQAIMLEAIPNAMPGTTAALPMDLMLIASYLAASIGSITRLRQHGQNWVEVTSDYDPVWASLAAPAGLLLVAPFIYVRFMTTQWDTSVTWVVVILGISIGLVTTARSYTLTVENAALRRSSTSDPLTGLYNHRFFHERLKAETSRAERERTPLSVIVFDLDDFDRVNNVYGHGAGDRCLQAVSERLASAARPADVLCRVGGDEFALIMPDTDPIEAYKVALRAQARVAEEGVAPSPVGLSAGIAGLPTHASTREQLVARADGALYWAKFHGREQIVIYDPDLVTALGPEQRIELLEEEAYLNMVQMLASAVDARDSYTQRHSRNVADLAMALARECGLDDAHVRDIETAALLHDVGKIGVPDAVLGKPGRLTAEERTLIEGHPDLAGRILGAMPKQQILPWITAHHERLDGQGFPDGLSGDEIPFEARIIALCDAYDAMTTDRPYRKALTLSEALDEVEVHAGTQFDSDLARIFVAMVPKLADDAHSLVD